MTYNSRNSVETFGVTALPQLLPLQDIKDTFLHCTFHHLPLSSLLVLNLIGPAGPACCNRTCIEPIPSSLTTFYDYLSPYSKSTQAQYTNPRCVSTRSVWQGFGSRGGLQEWLLWEPARNFLYVQQSQCQMARRQTCHGPRPSPSVTVVGPLG